MNPNPTAVRTFKAPTMTAAKFYIGLAGAVVIAALQFEGPNGPWGHWLTLASAVLTAAGVYLVPNRVVEPA